MQTLVLVILIVFLLPLTSDARPRSYNVQRLKSCNDELTEIASVDPERMSRVQALQCDDDAECIEQQAEAYREAIRIAGTVQPDLQREIEEAENEGKLRKMVRVSDTTHRVCSCARSSGGAKFAECVTGSD